MIYFFTGADRDKARAALNAMLEKEEKKGASIVRITDAHSIADFDASLQGGGLFGEKKAVVFDGIMGGENEALAIKFTATLPIISKSKETFFVIEGALDAATRKAIEKIAEKTEKFDAAKKEERSTIFALANALRAGDKKALWLGYHRELQKGAAPEAIHGVLFWAAKDMYGGARNDADREKAARLVAFLAELPHEARRSGFDMEFALEHFALSPRV